MSNITYHTATAGEAQILTDLRIRFAIELSGPQPDEMIAGLRQQMNAYFTKATSDGTCISIIAESDGVPVPSDVAFVK